jgi:hypothetical protein
MQVLSQVGFRTGVLQGGYKSYREHVRNMLPELAVKMKFNVLAGPTGSGKTYLLQKMRERGWQVGCVHVCVCVCVCLCVCTVHVRVCARARE